MESAAQTPRQWNAKARHCAVGGRLAERRACDPELALERFTTDAGGGSAGVSGAGHVCSAVSIEPAPQCCSAFEHAQRNDKWTYRARGEWLSSRDRYCRRRSAHYLPEPPV